MKSKEGWIRISSIIFTVIVIAVFVILFKIYKHNYFNDFTKAVTKQADTTFVRDSKVKYSEEESYKIQNNEYNDAIFYKEIEVEPNTPYRVSCMIKTENVVSVAPDTDTGAMIWLMDTTEYSIPVSGTEDWQKQELIFTSKGNTKVKIAFRLGGNESLCKGTAWFSDLKLEKGTKHSDSTWKIGCFILKNIDVDIDGTEMKFTTNSEDIMNVYDNMNRYKNTIKWMSNNQMDVDYDIYEIDETVTTISYEQEHGYYLGPNDTKHLIYDTVKENEYDFIFIVARMENESGSMSIPIKGNWVGLGAMDMYGIGYSIVRINKNGNTSLYEYNAYNRLPEEVYIHEFLHTLERTLQEANYNIPELHDYEKYGYEEDNVVGLRDWYRDYMIKGIKDNTTGEYVGLDSVVYKMKPYHSSDFNHAIEIELVKEPSNVIEEIRAMAGAITSIFK